MDAAVFDKAFGDLMKLVDRLMERVTNARGGMSMSMSMSSTQPALLRAELMEVAQHWQPDDKPNQAADIFFPSAHIRALALDRPLVVGMRGAGKSFWSEVLTDDRLRPTVASFIKGYDKLVGVCAIRWDQGGPFSTRLPDSTVLTQALQKD